jgi:hypothetical protein
MPFRVTSQAARSAGTGRAVELSLDGVQQTLGAMRGWEQRKMNALGRLLDQTELSIARTAKKLVSQVGRGHVYRRRGVTHRASAPGDPPANDLGTLRSRIRPVRPTPARLSRAVEVYDLVYAPALEFGTRDGRIKPRPFMGPAAQEHADFFQRSARRIMAAGGLK